MTCVCNKCIYYTGNKENAYLKVYTAVKREIVFAEAKWALKKCVVIC